MLASRISGMVKQLCWGVGYYQDPQPILRCIEDVLTNWPYSEPVQVLVTNHGPGGCHLHTKALVKIGSSVYPLILSECCEADVLAWTQNEITYLLASVIEETEQELSKLQFSGVEITDPLAALLLEMEQSDQYLDMRE